MFFNTIAVKIHEKRLHAKAVNGDAYVEFGPDTRVLSQSGITEEKMASSEWELVELD